MCLIEEDAYDSQQKMALYLEFIRKTFQEKMAYRFDYLFLIASSLIGVFIQINIWSALYKGHDAIKGVTLSQMLVYIIVASVVSALTRSGVCAKFAAKVSSGEIATDLIKPIHIKYYFWSEDIGNNSFQLLFVTIPTIMVVMLGYGITFSVAAPSFLLFSVSFLLGIMIAFHLHYLVGMLA